MANHDFAADIDAIVFDVVGTLVDEDATLAEVARRVADAVGVGDPADLHRRWTAALDEQITNEEVSPGMTAFVTGYQDFLGEYEAFIADPEGADIAALGVAADELADAGESLTTTCSAEAEE